MDTQEHQIKKSSSGRESQGVYLCTKCGWPFPKARPSAKHRRTHKKVCGTIEGYKLVESDDHLAASDGEHAPCEDPRTPSSLLDKRGVKELGGSGGNSLHSNRSADDLFSDAVAEFSDSGVSPPIEDHIKDLNTDTTKLEHSDSVEGQSFCREATAGTLDNPIAPIQSIKTSNLEVEEQVTNQAENADSSSEARIEESPVASIGVTALQFDGSPVIFESPTDELIEDIDLDAKDEDINKTLTGHLSPHVEAARESSEPYSSIEGTLENSTAPMQSIKMSNSEVDEQVISKSENTNSSIEARTEESPVASIGVTALPLDGPPVIFETPTDEPIEGIDADFKDEVINKSFLNSHTDATEESSDLYLNKIDEQTSDNIWEEESTPVAVIERQTKFEANENKTLDFVTQYTVVVNGESHQEKHLDTDNAITEYDGNKNGDQNEVHRIFEQTGVGKDMDFSLFRKKEEETTVSKLEEQNEADIAVYTLSMPASLAAIANVALIEDFEGYASPKSSLPPDLGSSEVTTYVGDDKQSAIPAQSVSGFHFCSTTDQTTLKDNLNEKELEHHITDKSCVSGSTEETINLVGGDNPDQCKMSKIEESDEENKQYNEKSLEDQLAANDKRTRGADSSFLSEDNQITSSLKVHHGQVLEEAVVELPEVCETIEKCGGAVEKNPEVAHQSAGPTQKSSEQKFDTRGNMDQIASSSCMAEYTLSQLGTGNVTDNTSLSHLGAGNVTDNTLSVASGVKNIERNHNVSSLSTSDNQGAFITNGVVSPPVGSEHQTSNMVDITRSSQASKESPGCGSESLQGKGDDKLETQGDGVSVSIASSSRADSMDANWGSVSVVSLQSDAAASADAGVPSEKYQTTSLPVHKDASESQTAKSDDFEPPSFMTLVEPGNAVPQKATPSDLSALSTHQQKNEDPKAGWFPSISNVVNDSEGRKKNEEIIDKVSSWSTGKKHSPLKSLLGEARSPNRRSSVTEKDDISLKNSVAAVTTVDSILRSEPNGKEIEKAWNSPARYPVEIKKERRKRKPYCIPFVCCLSVQQDL